VLTGTSGKRMRATLASPDGAKFKVVSANPPPPQRQNPGVSNLTVELPGKVRQANIVVRLASSEEGTTPAAGGEEKLDRWIAEGKLQR
jgi:hypothetical protein